jgi:hypothetical protein
VEQDDSLGDFLAEGQSEKEFLGDALVDQTVLLKVFI